MVKHLKNIAYHSSNNTVYSKCIECDMCSIVQYFLKIIQSKRNTQQNMQ